MAAPGSVFESATSVSLSELVDGDHTFAVKARDQAGNEDPSPAQRTFQLDTTPPITTVSLSGTQGNHGWYRSAVTATLAATDTGCGNANVRTEYRVNDGAWTTYSGPVAFGQEGTYTLLYHSVDGAGNVEADHAIQINIDWTPPVQRGTRLARVTSTASSEMP